MGKKVSLVLVRENGKTGLRDKVTWTIISRTFAIKWRRNINLELEVKFKTAVGVCVCVFKIVEIKRASLCIDWSNPGERGSL